MFLRLGHSNAGRHPQLLGRRYSPKGFGKHAARAGVVTATQGTAGSTRLPLRRGRSPRSTSGGMQIGFVPKASDLQTGRHHTGGAAQAAQASPDSGAAIFAERDRKVCSHAPREGAKAPTQGTAASTFEARGGRTLHVHTRCSRPRGFSVSNAGRHPALLGRRYSPKGVGMHAAVPLGPTKAQTLGTAVADVILHGGRSPRQASRRPAWVIIL